jgi:23S rRNA (pseudouridine1915-N3)-methyltransferase
MRITIVAVGRLRAGPEKTLVDHFAKRVTWPLDIREVEEKKNLTGDALKRREGELLLDSCPAGSQIIALDERGKEISSRVFAKKISEWQDDGIGDLSIVIGGADGLDEAVRRRANLTISFGRLTWPHMLVRGMLVEQLYRAQQIIAGHPYHRD